MTAHRVGKWAPAALIGLFVAGAAQAQDVTLPRSPPVPTARPHAILDKAAATTSIGRTAGELAQGAELSVLKHGLDALAEGDVAAARAAREGLPDGSLDRHILAWAIAMSDEEDVRSSEIASISTELSDWPGMEQLRANSERALHRESPSPREVVAAFGNTSPTTYEGSMALAQAHMALGEPNAARAVISPFWREQKLDAEEEVALLEKFGDIIPAEVHRYRMERMLYEERVRSAERVAERAGGTALTKAWAAVIRNQSSAAKLLDAVPQDQRSAGYIFAKARHLRRTGHFAEAAKVIMTAPRDLSLLIDPEEWWFERRVLSRELLDIDDPETAYRVVAAQLGGDPATIADAAFHAGWYALRSLDNPALAATHFARIAEVAEGPISLSRAFYWLGRAAEAGAPGNAGDYYRKAALYDTAYYGQLAAARIGRTTLAAKHPEATAIEHKHFAGREAVQAIRRLEAVGHAWRAKTLYHDLAEELASPGEIALLAEMAERRGDYFLALRVGKIAASRGLEIGALAHPTGAIPDEATISGSGEALAYAIARQESEFNVGAVSGAGARGLLQLMPGTARDMAQKSDLPYSLSRLTSDAGYSATLGSAYLDEQLDRFEGSYILTFIGYNAGPRRATEWIERYGDPRGKAIETVVDWVERIPFTETRNYVQRVMENYQVYKMRLTGRFDIADDLVNGR